MLGEYKYMNFVYYCISQFVLFMVLVNTGMNMIMYFLICTYFLIYSSMHACIPNEFHLIQKCKGP